MRRALAVFGARASRVLAVLALATLALAPAAHAQIVRNFGTRFSTNQPGDFTIVGNTIMSCNGGGGCGNARNGSGNNVNDNDWNMVYVDVDGDATTFSSSSAVLTLPATASVLWAGLYWGGYSNNAARGTVRLLTPAMASYQSLTSTQLDNYAGTYQGFVDVTTQVRAAGSGSYRVANVYSTPNTANVHGGWSLVVVYADATQPSRNLVVFDGYANVAGTTSVNLAVSGFVTPPAGVVNTRLGVVTYEGDLGYTGDAFTLNGTALSNATNPAANFFNSSISRYGVRVADKNPNYANQLGFDIDLVSASGLLPNSATSATIRLSTNGDTYYPGMVAFATDLYAPVFDAAGFTKSVTDLNGGTPSPGDVLEYVMTMRNTGQDHATACVMRDTLPAGVTYVPGSLAVVSGPNAGTMTDAAGDDPMEYVAASRTVVARLGTGANATNGGQIDISTSTSVRFRVTVTPPAPSGSVVSNQAAFTYAGALSGTAFAAASDGDAVTPGVQRTDVTITARVARGTVFEDANYGGGAGRTLAASAGTGVTGARLELYDATGAFLQVIRSGANGAYAVDGWPAGTYTVRVVNASVRSNRPGAVAGLLPVQTFRTLATSGSAVAVTDRVGGENPSLADADSNTTAATLATLATAAATPQSVTSVTIGSADVTGVDFGFNFDTIVRTRDAGQGTLRQFVLNANALGNSGLAQSGQTAGVETSIFMLPDGLAHAGLRAGLASELTSGVGRITLATALPALTDAATRLDGATQTANVGNTNAATLGSGGSVGADNVALGTVAAPEIELRDGAAIGVGVDLAGAQQAVANVAITGFGNAPASNADAAIRVSASAGGAAITGCVLGATASAWADPGATLRSAGDLVRVVGATGGSLAGSLLGFAGGGGLALTAGANNWSVSQCELRGLAATDPSRGSIALETSGGASITACLVTDGGGNGIDARTSTGTNTITNANVRRCGLGTGASAALAGVRLGGAGSRVDRCVIAQNAGDGVQVIASALNNTITRCAISGNGNAPGGGAAANAIGIDLQSASDDVRTGTSPYVTLNDWNDPDLGGNALFNFPVLESAVLANGSFTLTGWARPGSTIEVFVSDGDASGFGEGATYLTSLIEGSASDLDGNSSSYAGTINGLAQGTDITARFRFTVAAPSGASVGARLTATATLAGSGTSEFSGVVTVTTGVGVNGVAYEDANHDQHRDPGENGTGATLWAKLVASGGTAAQQVASIHATSGAYAFTFVRAGSYQVVLGTDSDPGNLVPARPAGWIGTEAASGVASGVNVNGTDIANVNFGLYHGSRVDGVLFRDDGAGGIANDGSPQAGEAALAGARVRLESALCSGGACDSTLSDGAGAFTLWLPAAGAGAGTRVVAIVPAGWLATGGLAGATGGTYARTSAAVTFTSAAGVTYAGLAFGAVPGNTFAPPMARSIAAGTATQYAHTFTAGSGGSVRFGVAESPSPALPGWSATLVLDVNGNGVADPGEPVLGSSSAVTLAAGQSASVVLRHAAPAGAPASALERATLTASFTYANASPALASANALDDVTTVAATSGLVIGKSVDRANARPGDALVYTITYTNPGTTPLSNIVIRDATPPWTIFDSAACATIGGGITGCALTTQPAAGGTGAVVWTLTGALAPGASGSVSYRVLVH